MNLRSTAYIHENGGGKAQIVIDHIQACIMRHELKAGDRIPPEGDLADMLRVSRTTIREAMKQLEANGIISVRRGDGTYVAEPTSIFYKTPIIFKLLLSNTSWEELFQFREVMEFSVIRCAIQNNITSEEIDQLKEINDKLFYLQFRKDLTNQDYFVADHAFHKKMAEIAKNRMLGEVYDILFDLTEPLIYKTYAEGVEPALASHRATIHALEKRDMFLAMQAAVTTADHIRKWSTAQSSNTFDLAPDEFAYIYGA